MGHFCFRLILDRTADLNYTYYMVSQRLKKLILLIGDLAIMYLSLWGTLLLRYQEIPSAELWHQHFLPFTVVYVVWVVVFYIAGMYAIAVTRNDMYFFSAIFRAMLINAGFGAVFFYLTPFVGISPKTNFVINLVLVTALILLWRQLSNRLIGAKTLMLNTLLIGESVQLEELIKELEHRPQLGYKICKTVRPSEIMNNHDFDLSRLIQQYQVKVVAAEPIALRSQTMVDQLFKIIPMKLKVVDLANFSEEVTGKIPVNSIGQVWFLENLKLASQASYEIAKRMMDLFGAILSLIILSWLIPIIAILIRLTMGSPILFTQIRTGHLGKPFKAMKFRTMIKNAETSGPQWSQRNDPRVTPLGRFLRKTRLDEIPQLINVIKGDMSFVGPRPERPEFVSMLQQKIPFYNERHLVKPGLTGWAQISFPYGASEEDSLEKLQYDLYYIKNRSIIFDIAIILKTAKTILSLDGSEGKKDKEKAHTHHI